jgi:TPR repeat protein
VFAEANTMESLHNIAGKGHFEYGDYKTAIKEFEMGAELDDADAQYNLGSMYFKGQGKLTSRLMPRSDCLRHDLAN